jgi:hypothetical protein
MPSLLIQPSKAQRWFECQGRSLIVAGSELAL